MEAERPEYARKCAVDLRIQYVIEISTTLWRAFIILTLEMRQVSLRKSHGLELRFKSRHQAHAFFHAPTRLQPCSSSWSVGKRRDQRKSPLSYCV